jgi:hypothetical protein
MIADLKADSERWEAERRATQSRGQPSNGISFRDSDGIVGKSNTPIVEYRASTTHQSRQYYGPTSETAQPATLGYQQPSSTPTGQVYDSAQGGYPQQSSYAQPPSAYQQSQGYAVQDSSNYYAGADFGIDPRSSGVDPRSSGARVPVTTQSSIPRSNVQYAPSSSTYPQQQDSRTMYSSYQQPGVAVSSAQYSQSQDPYYSNRAVPPAGAYDTQDPYGERVYQDSSAYSQIPVTAASASVPAVAAATTNSGSGRERDRDRERDRHAHGRRR